MAIAASDILIRLSGGSGNSDPNAALGGVMSTSTAVTDNTTHNLFDVVSGTESAAGDIEYRGVYVLNNHAGGYWLYEAQFEIIVSAKRLARDNVDAQLGNVEREIQRIVCLYTPNDIDGVDDIFYRGQERVYGIGESWASSNWATRIIIAVRYHSVNENAF